MNIFLIVIGIFVLENVSRIRSERNLNNELLSAVVYFRHGDKTPEKSFPTDEFFKLENFPMGLGQLTIKGIKRHYELGKWFRNRYSTLLPEKYSQKDILVRSTDVDRTLMSAEANLAGLYPPLEDAIWNENLLWSPIPVHTVPQSDDAILAMKKVCPRYETLYDENKNSDMYREVNKLYETFYREVSKYSGLDITDMTDIKLIRSVLYCYRSYNASFVPDWSLQVDQNNLDYLSAVAYSRYTATTEMKKLRAGPFLDYLVKYFDGVVDGCSQPSFLMFSCHDTEIASVLDAMGVYQFKPPGFADTIIWEMKQEYGIAYVNLFYKTEEEFTSLRIPGCETNCSYHAFKYLLQNVTVDQDVWGQKCMEKV